MIDQDNILNELKGLNSELPSGNNLNPYSVPEGYFEGLANQILAKVSVNLSAREEISMLSPLLSGLTRTMPYSVPENYFSENIGGLEGLTNEVESAPLTFISKQPPYEVPSGYFDSLADDVLARVKPQAKVIPMYRRGWMKVAVAAAITGIIAFAGFNYFDGKQDNTLASNTDTIQSRSSVAKVSPTVIKDLKTVSTNELDEFIKKVDAVDATAKNTAANHNKSKNDNLRTMLKDVSNDELENFLNQVPTANEELLITD
ncbi:MAG: hypothetical protein ACM3VS_14400 [Candidatus Dadabacteria bacterium]